MVLTIPFAVSGSAQPMLWQAVDDMRFRLAGAALKTPNATGGPVGQGAPGSARRILSDLTVGGEAPPAGTPAEVATVRRALREWQVQEVVITGASRDPVYASGFFTLVFGTVPVFADGAWVWRVQRGGPWSAPAVRRRPWPRCRAARRRAGQPHGPAGDVEVRAFTAGEP